MQPSSSPTSSSPVSNPSGLRSPPRLTISQSTTGSNSATESELRSLAIPGAPYSEEPQSIRITIERENPHNRYVKCWGGRKVRKTTLRRVFLGIGLTILVGLLLYRALQKNQTWNGVLWEVVIALLGLLIPAT